METPSCTYFRANEEIAQVRSKAKSETAALQATLRKEQMRIQSLERSLEQKVSHNAVGESLQPVALDLVKSSLVSGLEGACAGCDGCCPGRL